MNLSRYTSIAVLLSVLVMAVGCSSTAWKHASQADTEAAYETFLREYPHSDFAPSAKSRIRQIQAKAESERARADWEPTKSMHTIVGYEQFLQRHPNSQYSAEALYRLKELRAPKAWENTRGKDTIDDYETFLREYSATWFASIARARFSFLKGEAVVVFEPPRVMR